MSNDQQEQPQPRRRHRRAIAAGGVLASGLVAGGVTLAALNTASATAATPSANAPSASAPSASAPSASAPSAGTPAAGAPAAPSGGTSTAKPPAKSSTPVRSDEKAVTETLAAKLKAAALVAVPGGTVYRIETDAGDGVYEAHMTKADGSLVTVKFDKNAKVTKVETGMGAGDPAPAGGTGHGGPGGGRPGGAPAGAPGGTKG